MAVTAGSVRPFRPQAGRPTERDRMTHVEVSDHSSDDEGKEPTLSELPPWFSDSSDDEKLSVVDLPKSRAKPSHRRPLQPVRLRLQTRNPRRNSSCRHEKQSNASEQTLWRTLKPPYALVLGRWRDIDSTTPVPCTITPSTCPSSSWNKSCCSHLNIRTWRTRLPLMNFMHFWAVACVDGYFCPSCHQ